MPYLTISDEQRLKLKNQELEMRLAADTNRIKEAEQQIRKELETRERRNDQIIAHLSQQLEEMSKEMQEMRKERIQRLKERQSDLDDLLGRA